MSDTPFSSDVETADTLHLGRQWLGDVLDLALSLLLGWGLLRALDMTRTPGRLVVVTAGVWCVVCLVGGVSGWTLGQGLVGLRRVRGTGVPGASRGAARVPLALVDLIVSPILQRRVFDRRLGLEATCVPPWRGGLAWKGAWLVLALAAVWFMVVPTRTETLRYLKTLDGWRCCHGRTTPSSARCTDALSRAVRVAAGGDAQALALVADCPTAAAAMGR